LILPPTAVLWLSTSLGEPCDTSVACAAVPPAREPLISEPTFSGWWGPGRRCRLPLSKSSYLVPMVHQISIGM
jgi:hypothetical protein